MARKQANGRMRVFASGIFPGRYTVHFDDHIIGILQLGKQGAKITRLKLGRDEDGMGVYTAPVGNLVHLAKPYETTDAAANAVLEHWLGRVA